MKRTLIKDPNSTFKDDSEATKAIGCWELCRRKLARFEEDL